MAQLHGGVSNLVRNASGLGQKLLRYEPSIDGKSIHHPCLYSRFFRVEIEYELQLGSPTFFWLEDAKRGCKTMTQFSSSCLRSDHAVHLVLLGQPQSTALSTNFRKLLIQSLFLTSLLNDAVAGVAPKMSAIELHHNITLLGYRLVKLKPLGLPLGASSLQDRVHLGLTAFLITFLPFLDGWICLNDFLSQLLLAEVQRPSSPGKDALVTLLWLLFIGAASSSLFR